MKRLLRPLLAFACLLSFVSPLLADTIRLKDGSVIRGRVIGFKDQQFTISMGGGTKGRRGQTIVYVEDVESIEFDANTESGAAPIGNISTPETSTQSTSQPVRPNQNDSSVSVPRPVDTQPTASSSPTFFTIKVAVRADNANNGWTNSGLVVRKGQRLRISASGRVSLGRGRYSTPAGISTIPDNDKLISSLKLRRAAVRSARSKPSARDEASDNSQASVTFAGSNVLLRQSSKLLRLFFGSSNNESI